MQKDVVQTGSLHYVMNHDAATAHFLNDYIATMDNS